jgi:Spy/CpxP family protein refolding chaperone
MIGTTFVTRKNAMNFQRVFKNLEAVMLIMSTSTAPLSSAAIYLAAGAGRRVTKEISKMKKVLIHAALAVSVALSGATTYAQEPSEQGPAGQHMGMHGQPPSADQRLQRMTQQLDLTSEQQQQIKPILESESQQMRVLHQDSSLSQQDRMTKMQAIRQESGSQIKALLNPDQQAKFEKMMSRQGRGGPHGGYGQGGPSGAAPDGSAPQPQSPQ